MRVTSIEVQNSKHEDVLTLSFRDPSSLNPYIAKAITGLDGDEIIPKFYGVSEISKTGYFNLSLQSRKIVMRIALNPDFGSGASYSDLRDAVYRAIASSRSGALRLVLKDDTDEIAYIDGFLVKFEAPHFSKIGEIQVTLKCDDPVFKGLTVVSAPVAFGDHSDFAVIDVLSTAPHGFTAEYTFTSDSLSWAIQDAASPEWQLELIPGYLDASEGFLTDDILTFSSEFNKRSVSVLRGATTYNIANKIQPNGIWPILFPGTNDFVCTDVGTWDSIEYYPTYWGV